MLDTLLARLGEAPSLALAGLLIGVAFGFFAQRSRFCLRAAVIEFARGTREGRLTVWLFAFASAVVLTQAFALVGWFDASGARQISARGSLSGAAIGGALFGIGMILARGCASRLLVLAAHGNLRALLSGLVFAVTALSALSGQLAPLRLAIAQWWTVEGGTSRELLVSTGTGHVGGLLFGALWLVAALWWARRQRVRFWAWFGAIGSGAMVALAWLATYRLSRSAFDLVVPVQSLSFTGPAADVLWWVVAAPGQPLKFDLGLVPGVFIGSFVSAALWRELKLEGFSGGQGMRRYIAGAVLMGFGGMLAGGCAVGAGVSGAAVFTVTAFVTLAAMWASAALTDWVVDRRDETRAALPHAPPDPAADQRARRICGSMKAPRPTRCGPLQNRLASLIPARERETPGALPQPGGEKRMTHSIRLAAAVTMAVASTAYAQDTDLGRNLAASCANCHGTNGQAKGDTVKPLAGVSADKIVAALADYKSGAQPATIMHQIAKGYTDEQVRLIAAFFAAQPARK